MNELQALLLGVVQGLTEFLPISSSGHLILVPWVLDFHYLEQNPEFNKTFDVALHSGTLVAVLTYFRHDLMRYALGVCAALRRRTVETTDERLGWLIVIATIPAAAIGALFESRSRKTSASHGRSPSCWRCSPCCSTLADRLPERREIDGLSWRDAALVGRARQSPSRRARRAPASRSRRAVRSA